jgi:hypothetical protein
MTEEQARSRAEVVALAMGITFYVVRSRDGGLSAVQMSSQHCEVVATIAPPSSGHGAQTVGVNRVPLRVTATGSSAARREGVVPDRAPSRPAGTEQKRQRFYLQRQPHGRKHITKHLLAGAAAVALMSGVAFAQTYPPAPPPPPGTTVIPVPPPAPLPGSSTTTTTTVTPSPGGDHREVTIHKEVDEKGNTVTEKDTRREGVAGTSETHTKTETDRDGGTTTTHSKTTTEQR